MKGATGYAHTPFPFWEGRKVFLVDLRDTASSLPDIQTPSPLRRALDHLGRMSRDYPDDFFCCHKRMWKYLRAFTPDSMVKQQDLTEREKGEAANIDAKVHNYGKMLRDLHSIHEAMTEFFYDKQTSTEDQEHEEIGDAEFRSAKKRYVQANDLPMSRDDRAKLEYLDFVHAHVDVVADIVQNRSKDAIELLPEYQSGRHGPQKFWPMFRPAASIVQRRFDIVYKLQEQGCKQSEKQLEAAWWMLMVRGICWRMSVAVEQPKHQAMAPASLYGNQMPE